MAANTQHKHVSTSMTPMFYSGTVPGYQIGKDGQVPYQVLAHCFSVPIRGWLEIEETHIIDRQEIPPGIYVLVKKEYYNELLANQQK